MNYKNGIGTFIYDNATKFLWIMLHFSYLCKKNNKDIIMKRLMTCACVAFMAIMSMAQSVMDVGRHQRPTTAHIVPHLPRQYSLSLVLPA